MPSDETANAAPKGGKCPICGKPPVQKFRPFCSQRCQHIDLGRWLGERYRISPDESPTEPPGEPGEDES
ncbi:DNA gyrase inhibitor YacG [Dongia soli]|uniref:DNA gyrase inhibitor YacG n=1 Tax=Dongia soli TaxID=600628 RepID=A0ABU5E8E8_9PROT|nr:DNA gyrase inhibitor YacG [Dongia soli]MDY0882598.1 DNA gyrase inhibitor YacG [Dongia soli]